MVMTAITQARGPIGADGMLSPILKYLSKNHT